MNSSHSSLRHRHLHDVERQMLVRLIREKPHLSNGQIARIFERYSGRRISPMSVFRTRRAGYKERPDNGHLSASERELLALLIQETDRQVSYRAIAEQFHALSGRWIDGATVRQFAHRVLKLPPVGRFGRTGRQAQAQTQVTARP